MQPNGTITFGRVLRIGLLLSYQESYTVVYSGFCPTLSVHVDSSLKPTQSIEFQLEITPYVATVRKIHSRRQDLSRFHGTW